MGEAVSFSSSDAKIKFFAAGVLHVIGSLGFDALRNPSDCESVDEPAGHCKHDTLSAWMTSFARG